MRITVEGRIVLSGVLCPVLRCCVQFDEFDDVEGRKSQYLFTHRDLDTAQSGPADFAIASLHLVGADG